MAPGLLDRLRLTPERLADMATQLDVLAATPEPPLQVFVRELPTGERVYERRVPVGVIGAVFRGPAQRHGRRAPRCSRPAVRPSSAPGAAALGSAQALVEHVIAPALAANGVPAEAVQLVPTPATRAPTRWSACPGSCRSWSCGAAARSPGGSRRSARPRAPACSPTPTAAACSTSTPARPRRTSPGSSPSPPTGSASATGSTSCLVDAPAYDRLWPVAEAALRARGIAAQPAAAHPPARPRVGAGLRGRGARHRRHRRRPGRRRTDRARETSGLAACVCATDEAAATAFVDAYTGTGVFWNATTRLLDGYKLLGLPETGINVDHTPGPRGPVTYVDLSLRQFVVLPPAPPAP
jgi:glutamate-5-semialdehyde dehydrogenase